MNELSLSKWQYSRMDERKQTINKKENKEIGNKNNVIQVKFF